MGIISQGKNLWNALFTRTQRQLLGLFFGYPERSFYANEVVRRAHVGTGSVQRELARLTAAGLLTVRRVGNQKHYQANPDSPIYPEVRRIVIKTFGALDVLRTALESIPGELHLALLLEDAGEDAGTVLLVAEAVDETLVMRTISAAGERLGRTLATRLYSLADFKRRRALGDEELIALLSRPKVMLRGSLD